MIVAGDTKVDLACALDQLAEQFGVASVLCEGGPLLNRSLLAAGLGDELCLTVAPLLIGEPAKGIVEPPVPAGRVALVGLCEQDGELYARYDLRVTEP